MLLDQGGCCHAYQLFAYELPAFAVGQAQVAADQYIKLFIRTGWRQIGDQINLPIVLGGELAKHRHQHRH